MTLSLGFGAMNTGNNLVYMVFGMMLGFITASGVISEMSLRGLETDWITPQEAFAHSPFLLRLILRNAKLKLPSAGLEIETVLLHQKSGHDETLRGRILFIPAQGHAALDFPVLSSRRGLYTITSIKIGTRYPFGFFFKYMLKDQDQALIVYPKIDLTGNAGLHLPQGEKNRTTPEKGWGDTFWQIRDFAQGDNPRQISWKVSAKQSRLMVRETERETDKKILLFLGTSASWNALSDEEIESAVSFTASLTVNKFREGYAVGLEGPHLHLPPTLNRKNISLILRSLALFEPENLADQGNVPPALKDAVNIVEAWKTGRRPK